MCSYLVTAKTRFRLIVNDCVELAMYYNLLLDPTTKVGKYS